MAITSLNDNIARAGGLFSDSQPIWGERRAATTSTLLGNSFGAWQKIGYTKDLPTLPSGVTAYIPQSMDISVATNLGTMMVGRLINLGSIDISGASGTFTDGVAMPTITELGVSTATSSAVLVEVTTVLNATPGSLTITYTDQDGNGTETTTAQALTASAAVGTVGSIILNTADIGVRDITAATRSAGTTPTGVLQFWGVIPLGIINPVIGAVPFLKTFLANNVCIQRLGAGDQIGFFVFGSLAAAARAILGNINYIGE